MPKASPVRVRFALVAIFALMALGFLLSPGNAQPGRPPGGIGGRPPGGITGMPGGGITGRPPGGIGGISGISGISGMPGGISGVGGIGGMPGPGFGGGAGSTEWFCSGCRYVIGTGPVKPLVANCPRCGAKFSNGLTPGVGGSGFGGMPGPPPTLPGAPFNPGGAPPLAGGAPPLTPGLPPATAGVGDPGFAPPLPTNPAMGGATPGGSPAAPYSAPAPGGTPDPSASPPSGSSSPSASSSSSSDSSSSSSDSSSSGGRSKTIKLIGIVCGSILLIGALAALGVVVANANASKPAKRPKRRRVVEDDD